MTALMRRRVASSLHPVPRVSVLLMLGCSSLSAQATLYRSPAFTVTDTSVRQGSFAALALSRDTIISTYPRAAREVRFRFSLNGQDNEFRPGTEHTVYLRPHNGALVSPRYTFGVEGAAVLPTPEQSSTSEDGTARLTLRLDLRPVLRSFADSGVYHPPQGPPIRRADFRGVYVIGGSAPMTWDVTALRPGSPLELTDSDGDTTYTVTIPFETSYTRPLAATGRAIWARTTDLSRFPQLTSPQRLVDALYRMSLEELQQLVRSDGALAAGAKWEGVWTRDISLSSILALALVEPDAVRTSLLAKVDASGRIIQDTGTGGSWPVSTDRTTWALAAWELYAVTGDRNWLRTAYDITRRSAEADLHAAFDRSLGLFHGESSFMDWREQSYPRWMAPADIYQSQSLSTNAIHYATYRILANMARALGEPARRWDAVADSVRLGINAVLWQSTSGWYAEYRYGREFMSLSPRAEGLGEALAMIYGVASPDQTQRLARATPVAEFGVPSFWPFIPGEKLYHNAAIWPFVTAYWTWAAAEARNTAAVEHGLAATLRPAALFLTNKENTVAATGHFEGTELNSDRQLWSVAGTLSATYRVLFGIRLLADRMQFRPMVPPAYAGARTVSNLHYRGARLTVVEHGYGSGVKRATLDGRLLMRAELPSNVGGTHTVDLWLDGRWPSGRENIVATGASPAAPLPTLLDGVLTWKPVAGAAKYVVYRNGRPVSTLRSTHSRVSRAHGVTEYQVLAVDGAGNESFLSEPVRRESGADTVIVRPAGGALENQYSGFTGSGYLTMTRDRNRRVELTVAVPAGGVYALDVRYANGNGPVNTDAKTALRTVLVDGRERGVFVMPQRGVDLWSDWGYSNSVTMPLSAGTHSVVLAYTPLDENMNGRVNTALLDHVRLSRLSR